MKCANCGNEMEENIKFCPSCGTPVPAKEEAPVAEEKAAEPVVEEAVAEPVVEEKVVAPVIEEKAVESEVIAPTYNNVYVEPAEPVSKGLAIGSLVCGILSIVCCCCGINVIAGITGIILGCIQKKDENGKKPGMAIAGIITSSVGLLFAIIYLILNLLGVVSQSMFGM